MAKVSRALVDKRQGEQKAALVEQLKKMPIIQLSCEKAGVSRATFYRWRASDKLFAKEVEQALREGVELISDLAESQLISSIRDKNLGGIIFWLKNRHRAYSEKLEIKGEVTTEPLRLTPEQEALIRRALELADLGLERENHGD